MVLTQKQKEKAKILRLKRQKRERGELQVIEKWVSFLDNWCDESYAVEDKKAAEEKEKLLRVFEFRGKLFEYYEKIEDVKL